MPVELPLAMEQHLTRPIIGWAVCGVGVGIRIPSRLPESIPLLPIYVPEIISWFRIPWEYLFTGNLSRFWIRVPILYMMFSLFIAFRTVVTGQLILMRMGDIRLTLTAGRPETALNQSATCVPEITQSQLRIHSDVFKRIRSLLKRNF
ncbi:hypothetical protein D3C85_1295100 [compost metagenome]